MPEKQLQFPILNVDLDAQLNVELQQGRASQPPVDDIDLPSVIACEIINVHLDTLFQHLMDFQLGRISKTVFQEHLQRHASAVDEAHGMMQTNEIHEAGAQMLEFPAVAVSKKQRLA